MLRYDKLSKNPPSLLLFQMAELRLKLSRKSIRMPDKRRSMLRCAFGVGSLALFAVVPAAAAECTLEQYTQFKHQEPMPLGKDSLQSVLSTMLGCEIGVPDPVHIYSHGGFSIS